MIDTKEGYLPQNGLWWALGEVLSFTCADDPRQKWFWGIFGAQVIDTKEADLPQT